MASTPVILAASSPRPFAEPSLQAMFAARKRVFVDLLGWDVPVVDGCYEADQFDNDDAEYLIVSDPDGHHLASARLLRTTGPHILGSLFPELCAADPPRGANVREITRFCLDPAIGAGARREARNALVSALVEHALANGIDMFSGVAETAWLQQILAFGWQSLPLGLPRKVGGRMLGALRIDITMDTPSRLAARGIHRATAIAPAPALQAA